MSQRVAANILSSSSISDSPAVWYSSPVCPLDSKPLDFIGIQTVELLLTTSGWFPLESVLSQSQTQLICVHDYTVIAHKSQIPVHWLSCRERNLTTNCLFVFFIFKDNPNKLAKLNFNLICAACISVVFNLNSTTGINALHSLLCPQPQMFNKHNSFYNSFYNSFFTRSQKF